MSPEMLTGGTNGHKIGRKTDIWSMGCVIVELYRREKGLSFVRMQGNVRVPTDILDAENAREQAIRNFVGTGGIPEIPHDMPDGARSLVERCFAMDPDDRPSACDMLYADWFDHPDVYSSDASIIDLPANTSGVMEFVLTNKDAVPVPDNDLTWEVRITLAVRVLVHHNATLATLFRKRSFYAEEINAVKKVVEPGKPMDPKIHEWASRTLKEKGPIAQIWNPVAQFITNAVTASGPGDSETFTRRLPTIGPTFPDIAEWMNRYTHDYKYSCKGHATWQDIKPLIDQKEPVVAQIVPGELKMGDTVFLLAFLSGYVFDCPPQYPYVTAVVIHGYEGSNEHGDPDVVICTDFRGDHKTIDYKVFTEQANWTSSHRLLGELLPLCGYQPGQIIYRTRKDKAKGTSSITSNMSHSKEVPSAVSQTEATSPSGWPSAVNNFAHHDPHHQCNHYICGLLRRNPQIKTQISKWVYRNY